MVSQYTKIMDNSEKISKENLMSESIIQTTLGTSKDLLWSMGSTH